MVGNVFLVSKTGVQQNPIKEIKMPRSTKSSAATATVNTPAEPVTEATVTETTPVTPVVDVTKLDAAQRDALIKQLAEQKKAEREAKANERKAQRQERESHKVDNSVRDKEMLEDIATKLSTLDLTVTNSEPSGFRRYTGTVTIQVTEKDEDGNDTQVERTFNVTCTAREARR